MHYTPEEGGERSCSRFPIEMLTGSLPSCTYKDGVDELWRTGENRERDLFSWWKKVVPVTSDRICVSLWSCEKRGVWLKVNMEIWMSVCKGHVSAFCGSLYQQRICQSTDKSFHIDSCSSLVTLCIVNKLQDVIKGRARILELRWGYQSKKEFYERIL